jgi:hypothetical protein
MGKEHKGLADPLKGPLPYLVEHNCQGEGKQGSKNQKEEVKVKGIPDNHGGGVAFEEEFKIRKTVKGAAKDPQAVVETFEGYDDIRIGTVAVDDGIEGGRQQQQIPVRVGYNVVDKAFLCHAWGPFYRLFNLICNDFLLYNSSELLEYSLPYGVCDE